MDSLAKLSSWLDAFAGALESPERRKLAQQLGILLKRRFQQRIRSNVDPDGIRFVPRKRDQIGRIRRELMFARLNRRIKVVAMPDAVEIGFSGRDALIAAINQYGKMDKPSPHARPVRYAVRPLVGFSSEDMELVKKEVLGWFSLLVD